MPPSQEQEQQRQHEQHEQPVADRRTDYERRAMVDVALTLAELDASWGDYQYAIEYLDAANELTRGSIAPRWAARRRRWMGAARGYAAF